MSANNGIAIIKDYPDIISTIKVQNADLDLEGTYPKIEQLMNISKETTYRELCQIRGIPEEQQREIGINLTGGVTNAIELCQNVFQLPAPNAWLTEFQAHLDKQKEKEAA